MLSLRAPIYRGEAVPLIFKMNDQYYIYIMANKHNTVLYTGVTNNLIRRIYEHKEKLASGFTKRYNINKLVYYEVFQEVYNAIKREKQIKGGSRQEKIDLINSVNPDWKDLYEDII
jgi:putative endonuclease